MTSANVLSIHALEELKGALGCFNGEAIEALNTVDIDIRRTFDWLQERRSHWQNEVRLRQEQVARVKAALAACQASGYYDPRTGQAYVPDCSAYQNALLQAQVRLREAEAELQNVQGWIKLVDEAYSNYHRQAQRLAAFLNAELPKATALLGRKVVILQNYVAMSAPSVGNIPVSNSSFAKTNENTSAQDSFRRSMVGLSPQERGAWGEVAVLNEAGNQRHRILLQHGNVATIRGYDCVTWDGKTLHIWEAKNYSALESGQPGIVNELSAMDAEKRRGSTEQFLHDLAQDDPDRLAIANAIQRDQVQWHIRLGPDTDVSFKPLNTLDWGNVDISQYSHDDMMRLFTPPGLGDHPGQATPPEFREGVPGGTERGG